MKAAVLYEKGGLPQYVEIPEPTVQNDDELLVQVKAVALKHFDKGRATGQHYSSTPPATGGRVIGGDGIVVLEDGTRVYGMAVDGMLAEKAVIHRNRIVPVPHNLDDLTAAALPNAVIGAAMGLRFKADIQPGDVALINGATGFTGRVAIQIAKHYGAGKVIVTGRDPQSLKSLKSLGADEYISLQDEAAFKAQLKAIHTQTPIDVIIDYLWGRSAEWILTCLQGDGSFTNKIRYVSVGSVMGDSVQLSAALLRSIQLQLSGSGLGAWTRPQVGLLFTEILPDMFQLAADGKLVIETTTIPLQSIKDSWDLEIAGGQRLVVTI